MGCWVGLADERKNSNVGFECAFVSAERQDGCMVIFGHTQKKRIPRRFGAGQPFAYFVGGRWGRSGLCSEFDVFCEMGGDPLGLSPAEIIRIV